MQPLRQLGEWERLNFLLTNRIPRHAATRFMGWFSRIESPALTRVSLALWRLFADDLRLDEASERRFRSLHACFTRSLRPGARQFDTDPAVVCSPCDAEVGAVGRIRGDTVFQAKGFPYELGDLLPPRSVSDDYRDGVFVTLRLKSSMYHRFHAPVDCSLREVTYVSGDTWNVNPIALRRIEKLYCKNERVVLELFGQDGPLGLCLVPVAAILVAGIRLHALPHALDLGYRGPRRLSCPAHYARGDELGYFQHGSTIILLARRGFALCPGIRSGRIVDAGEALLACPETPTSTTPSSLEATP